MAVLTHLGRTCRYLQNLVPKYSSSANINICSHVERECVVHLPLVEWWGNIIVNSTEKCFYLFSRSALLRWNGLPGGSRPVVGRDLAGEHPGKDSSIYLSLSLSWEIGICIICFQCQHWLPGTAASLGRALWWVENWRSTEELLITADRQISFWRATRGLSTPVKYAWAVSTSLCDLI